MAPCNVFRGSIEINEAVIKHVKDVLYYKMSVEDLGLVTWRRITTHQLSDHE